MCSVDHKVADQTQLVDQHRLAAAPVYGQHIITAARTILILRLADNFQVAVAVAHTRAAVVASAPVVAAVQAA